MSPLSTLLDILWSFPPIETPFTARRGVHPLQVDYFPMTSYYLSLLQQAILPPSNHCASHFTPSRTATFIQLGSTKGFEDQEITWGRIYLSTPVVMAVVFCAATPQGFPVWNENLFGSLSLYIYISGATIVLVFRKLILHPISITVQFS